MFAIVCARVSCSVCAIVLSGGVGCHAVIVRCRLSHHSAHDLATMENTKSVGYT